MVSGCICIWYFDYMVIVVVYRDDPKEILGKQRKSLKIEHFSVPAVKVNCLVMELLLT